MHYIIDKRRENKKNNELIDKKLLTNPHIKKLEGAGTVVR